MKFLGRRVSLWLSRYANKVTCSILLSASLAFATGVSLADDDTDTEALNTIYELSGVDSHLSWVLSVVQQESKDLLALCSDQDNLPDIEQTIKETLSAATLRISFLNKLKERITPIQRKEILAWANSAAGQQIYSAESDAINVDEAQFSLMYEAYEKSDMNTEARTDRIRTMLKNTGAVYFVSAINTEMSALVSISSVCTATPEAVSVAVENIKKERGEEALYRTFMRQELVTPAKVIYQNVTDENIDAYIEFSNSDAGQAYFSALIKGIRSVLSNRVDLLNVALKAL